MTVEFTVDEAKALLDEMSGEYDLARIVDPIECRILDFSEDGSVNMASKCYGIWNAGFKCTNCHSATACRTGQCQIKEESFDGKLFEIESRPITLKLEDGQDYEAVMELVTVDAEPEKSETLEANDREAENVDHASEQYQAAHDDLTKVLDANAFYELSRDMMLKDPDAKWTMVTANIMNFRLVNTLFGDHKGNEVLVETARKLKDIAIEADGACGRIGGDQFAILLPQASFDEGEFVSISEELAEAFSCGIYTFVIHFGVYHLGDASIPVSVMCGRANSALRTIRDDVRKTVAYFDDELFEKTLFEQAVIGGFDEALEHGQFQMFLQPLVGSDGQPFGAEALARWVKPDGSIVMPGEFIEILEGAGLIHELDVYIWECAVKQLSEWKRAGREDLLISVNMSAKDLYNADVYEVFRGLVEKYDVSPSCLRIEITETALLEEPESAASVLERLRRFGFAVAIDDFGKGYSSLSMLKDIHADVLKIDMSLLQEIEKVERARVIVGSIINMAQDLGMDVITEGVETKDQLRALEDMGCTHFQGYYFARPMKASDFDTVA